MDTQKKTGAPMGVPRGCMYAGDNKSCISRWLTPVPLRLSGAYGHPALVSSCSLTPLSSPCFPSCGPHTQTVDALDPRPPARAKHTASAVTLINNPYIYIYGGVGSDG